MGNFLLNILLAVLPSIARAILERFTKKSDPPPVQTASEAVLEVATKEAEVQHAINEINSKPLPVDDALARLRERAEAGAKDNDGRGA